MICLVFYLEIILHVVLHAVVLWQLVLFRVVRVLVVGHDVHPEEDDLGLAVVLSLVHEAEAVVAVKRGVGAVVVLGLFEVG